MKDHVVENYENYEEENRLTTNNARKIEFLITARIMDEWITGGKKVLDCAAGTGIYAFYLADKGMDVTATDITPRHIEIVRETLKTKDYEMRTAVQDAMDLSMFPDHSFDVVLNMGPFYHLLTEEERSQCLAESLRVLKKGGLLFSAYIPRFYICQLLAFSDTKYLDKTFTDQIMNTGIMRYSDEKCFWTDAYFSSAEEMEQVYKENHLDIVDHFAQDGLAPMHASQIDQWTEEEFGLWCEHHYRVCREKSILGQSNHVIIVGRYN